MSLTSFLVSRSWASNRLRTVLTVLGIALGVAIVIAIHVMDHNTVASRLRAQLLDRGTIDLELVPGPDAGVPEAVLADLGRRQGVAGVSLLREGRATLRNGDRTVEVGAHGISPLPATFGQYVVGEGTDLGPASALGELLLGNDAAVALGVRVGDTVQVEQRLAQRVECREGRLSVVDVDPDAVPWRGTARVAGILQREGLGRREFGMVLVGSLELLEALQGGGTRYQVRRTPGADLDRLRRELGRQHVVLDNRSAMLGEGADERAFRNGLKVLGCLALVLGMFGVFQTLSQGLVSRIRTLALLRCIGSSRGAIERIFLGDALAMGLVGSALGTGLGLLLALMLRNARISSLGYGKEWLTFEVPPGPVLGTAALGVLFTLAGASYPLWRARNMPTSAILEARGLGGAELLRGVHVWLFALLVVALPAGYLAMTPLVSEEGMETLVVLLQLGGMLLLLGGLMLAAPPLVRWVGWLLLRPLRVAAPLAAWLAQTVLRRSAGRVAAAACGLAAVLLAFLGLNSLTESLREEVRVFARDALDGRLFLEGVPMTPATARSVLAVEGVAAVEPEHGRVGESFLLSGLALEDAAAAGGALEQDQSLVRRYGDTRRRTLVASHRLAAQMGWVEGTLVSMHDRNGDPVAYEVLHVSDRSGYQPSERSWAVTAPFWMQKDFCVPDACVQRATLRLQPGADPEFVMERLRKAVPGYDKRRSGEWIREYHLRDVTRDFALFDILLVLVLVLATSGLVNGMTIAAMARLREIGVMRALGVGAGTLRLVFLFEGAVVALLASVLALALCVPMAHILVGGLNAVAGLQAPVVVPREWLGWTPLLAFGTALVAALLPALRASRQSPAAAVRYE